MYGDNEYNQNNQNDLNNQEPGGLHDGRDYRDGSGMNGSRDGYNGQPANGIPDSQGGYGRMDSRDGVEYERNPQNPGPGYGDDIQGRFSGSYNSGGNGGRFSGNFRDGDGRMGRDISMGGRDNYTPPRGNGGFRESPGASAGRGAGIFGKVVAGVIIGLIIGGLGAAGAYGIRNYNPAQGLFGQSSTGETAQGATQEAAPNEEPVITRTVTKGPAEDKAYEAVVTDVSQVVEAAMPSMVSITSKYVARQYFFGQAFESEGTAGGSGIIVGENDSEFLIVTNQHVISGAEDLIIKFIDDEEVNAYVKGYDSDQDIAVVAVNKADVKDSTKREIAIAVLGDSGRLTLGEPTIAIGNALGYGQSVTTGVVSALDREIGNDGKEKFIQTDAAINPGNSGGALLNIEGEVIGINSNKFGGGVVEGMGYAIPISRVKPLIEDFMNRSTKATKATEGKQAYLGISGVDVTAEVSQTYNMPQGVYVAQIHDDSAALKAGIQEGDIIIKFDGSTVKTMTDLQELLSFCEAGANVDVVIKRSAAGGFEELTIPVTLGNRQDIKE